MRTTRYAKIALVLLPTLGLVSSVVGCTSFGIASVRPRAEVIDRTTQALSVGALKSMNGTYGGGCLGRSGAWSVRISGSDPLTNPELTVATNDSACTLTVTSLVADQAYTATPAFAMTSSYQGTASEFRSGGNVAFYGNARLSSASFGADFVISILYSDDVAAANNNIGSTRSGVDATTSATSVEASNYGIDFGTNAFSVEADAADVVTDVSGSVILADGTRTGADYVLDMGTLPASPTFAEIDAVYAAATPVAIGGANPTIAATAFGLVGEDLTTPVVRTIIIRRATSDVTAYQTFKVTFSPPP